ncbi:hypothetical protein J4457_07010 [Candidatus Woesearchaeota archaeon]|nr:hypothetical protein [Candidatus Woesearchaeota archaeon]
MQIKIRIKNKDGVARLENTTRIQEVMINEDLLHPDQESIAIGFRNQDSSGIIEFTVKEFEDFYKTVRSKIHLVKGARIFGGGGAYLYTDQQNRNVR